MSSSREHKKKHLKILVVVLLLVFLLSGVMLLINIWEQKQGVYDGDISALPLDVIEYDGVEYVPDDDIETFLLLGLDKVQDDLDSSSYNNDQQADFLMLFVVDNENSTCTALHINRDTMVEIDVLSISGEKIGTVNEQIALAHTYGSGDNISCHNTSDAVSRLLKNIDIDHYISVTMDCVPVYNDLVGGIEVEVLDDFSGIDDTLVKGETVTLTGDHALTYVRTRYGMPDSTNNHRMLRQQQYMDALFAKTKECIEEDDNFIVDASLSMSEYLVSDCTVNQLQTLLEKLSAYELSEIRSLEGESVKGEVFMEFYPTEDSILQNVTQLFYQPKE